MPQYVMSMNSILVNESCLAGNALRLELPVAAIFWSNAPLMRSANTTAAPFPCSRLALANAEDECAATRMLETGAARED
ncbi:hypothetical protein X734_03835 [Mesorhizobium sp. L2C084A000]|nr:hypothetical protein X734_03835 [Mesorhizobium sp. L2C084A000]